MPGRSRWIAIPLLLAVLLSSLLPNALQFDPARAGPAQRATSGLLALPARHQQARLSSEIDDLIVAPIDDSMSATDVMRSRPFILNWDVNPAFSLPDLPHQPLSELEARDELTRLLALRELDAATTSEALALFDDPSVTAIIPAPSLRCALLMLYQMDPYQVIVDAVLDGHNETGLPFSAVEFADLAFQDAVATILYDPAFAEPRYRLQIAPEFAVESPLQLAPVIIHESLHGDGLNSAEEEIAANILDTIAYAELLLIDPQSAYSATELSAYNNIQLYALLNSIGAGGGGHIGISDSISGDVFVGPGLEDFDASSIRQAILQDEFYGSLESGGAAVPLTTARLIERFHGHDQLGTAPVYDEALLALIDREAGEVVTPDLVRRIATILGLSVTLGSAEPAGTPLPVTGFSLQSRPFVPLKSELFDLNQARGVQPVENEHDVRHRLETLLGLQPISVDALSQALALFDSPLIVDAVPDPQLRAALLLLWPLQPWSETAQALLLSTTASPGWSIAFAPLPAAVNARSDVDADGRRVVHINQFLSGDRLEVIAAALLEGVLLEEDRRSPNAAVLAALMSTLAYGDLVTINPSAVRSATWGTISRNRDLLALVNSSRWSAGGQSTSDGSIGFLAPANGAGDVLPGLTSDAASFQSYVLESPRLDGTEQMSVAVASELFARLLMTSGIPLEPGPGGPVITAETMSIIDTSLNEFLSSDDIHRLVDALFLGIAA